MLAQDTHSSTKAEHAPKQRVPEPIRVLFVINQLGLGGQEKRLVELLTNLDPNRVEVCGVVVAIEGGEWEAVLREAGITVMPMQSQSGRRIRRMQHVYRVCRRYRPDVVHAFDVLSGIYACLASRLARTPVFISSFNNVRMPAQRVFYAERLLWRLKDKIICNSHRGRRFLEEQCRVAPDRLAVIVNGFDFDRMAHPPHPASSLRTELGLHPERPLVGLIGKLKANKDPLTLARAAVLVMEKRPDAVFCIIGSGSYRDDVAAFIEQHKLAGRFFLIPQRPDAAWLARDFDVGVLSSRFEGMPNVVLEYMFWEKPCVVTDVGDSGDVVQHGHTGLVVPPGDPEALARSILSLLDDPQTARQMGRAGRARLNKHYRIERYIDDLMETYSACLG